MTSPARAGRPLTLDGFLAFLEHRPNGERWWLDDGVPVMNPMPTRRHDWIQLNILSVLLSHWRSRRPGWRPAGPTQVPVPGHNRTVAPDALVAPEPDRDDVSITPDPIVVFEVLSKSDTAARRARKLADYEAIASIRHCVTVRQDRREVTVYHRGDDGRFAVDVSGDAVALDAIGVTLTLAEIYAETPLAG